jgi:hypothetical protein
VPVLRNALDRFFTPRVTLLVGWIVFLLYAYPGYMTSDSVTQLNQARGVIPRTEWHPPFIAFVWHYVDNIVAGPFGMLVIQSVAFLLGTHFVLVRYMSRRRAAIVASVLLIVPGNIVVMSVVWKDAMMSGFLVAGAAGLFADRLRWRLVGCLFIFLATAVRYNAVAATLPLVVLMWDRDLARAWYKRYAAALAVWAGLTVAAVGVNAVLVQQTEHVFEIGSAPGDIAGTLHYATDVNIDALVRDTPDVPWKRDVDIRKVVATKYKPANAFLYLFDGEGAIFDYPESDRQAEALAELWKRVVREHPGAFLRHRVAVSKAQLNCRVPVWHEFTMGDVSAEDQTHHRAQYSRLQRAWIAINYTLVATKLVRPRLYFYLSLVLLPLARRRRLAIALLSSGLANELLLFAVAPSIAYRYSHWMVYCAILGAIVLVAERMRSQR